MDLIRIGKNTIHYKVDGEVFVEEFQCPCGEGEVHFESKKDNPDWKERVLISCRDCFLNYYFVDGKAYKRIKK